MPLNDRQIRNAKPAAKEQQLSDGGGLYLLVKPNGGKYWRLNFRFGGKQKTLAIGTYPAVSLVEARAARERAKQMLAQGTDPSAAKQAAKQECAAALANTFKAVAQQWHTQQLPRETQSCRPCVAFVGIGRFPPYRQPTHCRNYR